MSETLETKARRIGDDVTAIWDLIRAKGGMIPHNINTENLADVINQYDAINKWMAKGLFLYNYDASYFDFYTTHEVMRMTELPPLPTGATGWPMTLAEVQGRLENSTFLIMMADGATQFDGMFTTELTSTTGLTMPVNMFIDGSPDDVMVSWGDGVTEIAQQSGQIVWSHTYSQVGEYTVSFIVRNNTTIYLGGSNQNIGVFGLATSSGTGSNLVRKTKMVIFGPKVGYTGRAFGSYHTAMTYSRGVATFYKSEIVQVNLGAAPLRMTSSNPYNGLLEGYQTDTIDIPAAQNTNLEKSAYAFAGNQTATSIRVEETPTVLSLGIFYGCNKVTSTNIDFSKVKTIEPSALAGVQIPGELDLSGLETYGTMEMFRETAFSSVVLPPVQPTKTGASTSGNEWGQNWAGNTSITSLTIPSGWTEVPDSLFGGISASSITIPEGVTKLGNYCFAFTKNWTNVVLPDSIEELNGLQNKSTAFTFNWPSSLKLISRNAFYGCNLSAMKQGDTLVIPALEAFQIDSFSGLNADTGKTVFDLSAQSKICLNYWSATETAKYLKNIIFPTGQFECYIGGFGLNTMNQAEGIQTTLEFHVPAGTKICYESSGELRWFTAACIDKLVFDGDMDFENIYDASWPNPQPRTGSRPSYFGCKDTFNLFSNVSASGPTGKEYIVDLSKQTSVWPVYRTSSLQPGYLFTVKTWQYQGQTVEIKPKIIVSDALYNDWITAPGWSTYAQYFVKESEA